MYKKAKGLITVCLILCCVLQTAISQNLTLSPYSYYGPGELQFMGNASNLAKGRVSQGIRRSYEINSLNPASYGAIKNTIIEAGFAQNNGTIKNAVSSTDLTTVGFSYVNFGIPISEKRGWGLSFGLMPFSSIGYKVVSVDSIPQDTFNMAKTNTFFGKGGLTKFYIGMGYKIYKDSVRSLSVGVNLGYIFGNLNSTTQVLFPINYLKFNVEEATNRYTGGLIFDYGLQFEQLLSKKSNPKKTTLVAGLTMNARTELNSTRQYVLRSLAIGGSSRSGRDTALSTDNESGTMTLPMGLKGGLSINYDDKILLAADVEYSEWNAYKTTWPSSGTSGDALRNSMAFAFGGSYIQDVNDYNNFLKRVEYRAGFRYEQSNIIINNNGVDVMGISAGLGLPMGKSRSKVNLSFEYLKRGNTSNNLIQEDYYRFILGITFADRWFVRYRYD
jgi:hypothetical protein